MANNLRLTVDQNYFVRQGRFRNFGWLRTSIYIIIHKIIFISILGLQFTS